MQLEADDEYGSDAEVEEEHEEAHAETWAESCLEAREEVHREKGVEAEVCACTAESFFFGSFAFCLGYSCLLIGFARDGNISPIFI